MKRNLLPASPPTACDSGGRLTTMFIASEKVGAGAEGARPACVSTSQAQGPVAFTTTRPLISSSDLDSASCARTPNTAPSRIRKDVTWT